MRGIEDSLLGALCTSCFRPRRSGIPPYSDYRRRSKRTSEMGVKGMLPLGCFPLWGRVGVTLINTVEDWRVTGKRGFLQTQKYEPVSGSMGIPVNHCGALRSSAISQSIQSCTTSFISFVVIPGWYRTLISTSSRSSTG